MRPKKYIAPVIAYMQKLAPEIGAEVIVEPEWGIAAQIIFKSGRKRYIRFSSLDLNTLGASDIAKDKDYAAFFMQKLGYATVEGRAFFSDAWAEAIDSDQTSDKAAEYAKTLSYPVFVKPNSGSQGMNVALVHDEEQLRAALTEVFLFDRIALVQRPVTGKDYRIVVLDGEVISAYQRIPLSVTGDGISSIRSLLQKKQQDFEVAERDTRINTDDIRITQKLALRGMDMQSVLQEGERIELLDNANLSSGGDSVEVTDICHPSVRALAIKLTEDMGLRVSGVDLMLTEDISQPLGEYRILEINAAPGLDHYASSGPAQQKVVEDMYLRILKSMEL